MNAAVTRLVIAQTPAQTPAQTRDQIREQVQRDVEEALRGVREAQGDARQAQMDARQAQRDAAQREGDAVTVVAPPMPPMPPSAMRRRPIEIYTGTGPPPMGGFTDIPPRVEEVAIAFFITVAAIFIGTPIARAFGRRMDRRPVAAAASASPEVVGRLERIEQAVDAVALEVERISEGQRYVTKLMGEPRALPAPNAAAENEARLAERALNARVGEPAR